MTLMPTAAWYSTDGPIRVWVQMVKEKRRTRSSRKSESSCASV